MASRNAPPPRSDFSRLTVTPRLGRWRTNDTDRTVLVVVRTVTSLMRLLDVVALLETDHRIQVVFTHDPRHGAIFSGGLRTTLESAGAAMIPWRTAVRTRFDLALAASENDALYQLRAPVVLLSHGFGYQKYYPVTTTIAGMDPRRLLYRGKPVPRVIALAHPGERTLLQETSPRLAGRARVVGDPCLDRILASRYRRRRYRSALGAGNRTLVVLGSTWGPGSLFGTDTTLPERLLGELPADEYRVVASMHTGVWEHGPRQLRSWLSRARERGLLLLPEDEGWRAAIVASDVVVSDRGSLTLYGLAAQTPVLLTSDGADTTVAGSAMDELATRLPRLRPDDDVRARLDDACAEHDPQRWRPITERAVSGIGAAAARLRSTLYELVDLPEPHEPAEFEPLPAPEPEHQPVGAYLVGATITAGGVRVERFPARGLQRDLNHRHRTADPDHARMSEVDAAAVLHHTGDGALEDVAAEAFRGLPNAHVVAAPSGSRTCLVRARDGRAFTLHVASEADPLLAASLAHVRLTTDGAVPAHDVLLLGPRRIAVTTTPGIPASSGSPARG